MQQMCYVIVLCVLLRMTYQDIKNHSVSAKEAGLVFIILGAISWYEGVNCFNQIKSLIPGISLLVISYLTKEQIGYGDGIVFILMGSILSLKEIICVLLLSLFMSTLFSIACLFFKKCGKRSSFPFVPFITGAYLIWMVCEWS